MTHHRPFRLSAALVAALALTLAGCATEPGDDGSTSDAGTPDAAAGSIAEDSAGSTADTGAALDAFPVTVDTPTGEVTIEERPERIVSLSASATEILFAIGAGEQLRELIKGRIGVTVDVAVVDPGSVERSVGKMRRIVDQRGLR